MRNLMTALMAAGVGLSACADEAVASDEMTGLQVDTRVPVVNALTSVDEICTFACNNATDWRQGGDGTLSPASVRLTPMSGDGAADPSMWTPAGASQSFAASSADCPWTWELPCSVLYRAELVQADGTVLQTAYFNLTGATDAKTSLTQLTVTLDATSFVYTSGEQRPTVTVKDKSGVTLQENIAYVVVCPSSSAVGVYELKVSGIGDYGDALAYSYAIAYPHDESEAFVLDARDVSTVLEFATREELAAFAYNADPDWPLGGPADVSCRVRISWAPMATESADPDESRRSSRTKSGEGLFDWRSHGMGYYQLKLEFLMDGIVDETKTLTRVAHLGFADGKGMCLIFR